MILNWLQSALTRRARKSNKIGPNESWIKFITTTQSRWLGWTKLECRTRLLTWQLSSQFSNCFPSQNLLIDEIIISIRSQAKVGSGSLFLTELYFRDLSNNQISVLPPFVFSNLTRLATLIVSYNKLQCVQENAFGRKLLYLWSFLSWTELHCWPLC